MSESSEREEQIFAEALALPAGERQRFIDESCRGDDDLRKRIEALILAHDSAGRFMAGRPAEDLAVNESPSAHAIADGSGKYIGRYKLLQKLGEGGCGIVWMAEQAEPVRRRIALKVIKLGMDTKEVIARFDAERQALAMMDHPNIAKILDAGSTEEGRPFFVMELVRGVKITDFCDQYSLSTKQRLELFSQICHAVQHAHQKGIIHRDLKPSNILVTLHDGVPVPKVIDFGIAKATEGRLTDRTLYTAFEQFMGTPAYMSPEQAEMSGIDIDTRSDIYSLGVLLYELLTGRPPFDPKSLLRAGLDEIRRIIREVDPPKPSTNLSTLADADRTMVARLRGTDPARLSVLIRGDLDWIVMRCLEKNRTRRYDTPSALAADIARHLHDEPVVACPPSRAYRFGKLVRRNRFAVAATTIVAMALIAGMAISTWQAIRATRAERLASIESGKAANERARAEDLITFMLGDLRKQLERVGRLGVLESVGEKAKAYFASISPGDQDDTTLDRHAKALTQIGEIRIAQARYEDAAAAFVEAYSRAAALAARHPKDGGMLFDRGQSEYWIGFVHWQRGEFPAAKEWLSRYRDTSEALVALDPARPAWQSELAYGEHNLAALSEEKGELATAQAGFSAELITLERIIGSDPNDSDLRIRVADTHSWLGGVAEKQGKFADASGQYEAEARLYEELTQADPGNVGTRSHQANALLFQVDVDIATGQFNAAERVLMRAKALLDALVTHDGSNVSWHLASLSGSLKEAKLDRQRGDADKAGRLLDEIAAQFDSLSTAEPSDGGLALGLATALRLRAQLRFATVRADAASTDAKQAVAIGERLIRDNQASNVAVGECATAYIVSGEIAARSGDAAESRRDWLRAAEVLAPRMRESRDWRLLDPAARAAALLGRSDEARAWIGQLNLLGYVPLDPWPTPKDSGATKNPDIQQKQGDQAYEKAK
jgi:tetratricopeptide (TPR) repeat protein